MGGLEDMWRLPEIRGTFFLRGPYNEDYSMWGAILGSPHFLETTMPKWYILSAQKGSYITSLGQRYTIELHDPFQI